MPAIPIIATVGGGLISAFASNKASKAQSSAAADASATQLTASRESNALQERMYNQNRQDSMPWLDTGRGALNQLAYGMGIGQSDGGSDFGSLNRNFSEVAPELRQFSEADYKNDFVAQNGLQFGLDEGSKAAERQGAASGMQLSGATLKALTRYGNDYGTRNTAGAYDRFRSEQDQGYGRYVDRYNRFNADNANQFNRLSGIAGAGQAQVNQQGAAGQNYASQVGSNTMNTANNVASNTIGAGNARAGNYQAIGNAINSGIGDGVNAYQQNQWLQRFPIGSSGGT